MKAGVLGLVCCRHNPDILVRNEILDPFDGLAQEGIFSCDLEHLLGAGFTAQGPETGTRTTGENDGKNILHSFHCVACIR